MNRDDMIEVARKTMVTIYIFVILWISISTVIQRFKTPELTETELLLRIPKSFICDWYN